MAPGAQGDSLGHDPGEWAGHPALGERIEVLEQRDRETAELLTRVTAQIAALTTAGEVLEARVRWLLVIAIAAAVISVVAGIALLVR
jgi:hypothetical protein